MASEEDKVDPEELYFDLSTPESGMSDINLLKIKYLERENRSQRAQLEQILQIQTLYANRLNEIMSTTNVDQKAA